MAICRTATCEPCNSFLATRRSHFLKPSPSPPRAAPPAGFTSVNGARHEWEDKDLKKLISLTLHWIEVQTLTLEVIADMPEGKPLGQPRPPARPPAKGCATCLLVREGCAKSNSVINFVA
jgi:hypothetical protein